MTEREQLIKIICLLSDTQIDEIMYNLTEILKGA